MITSLCCFASDSPVCQWSGVQPSAPNGSLSDELCVPQVLVSLSFDLLTQNTPNVNRSSQLITNLRMKSVCDLSH